MHASRSEIRKPLTLQKRSEAGRRFVAFKVIVLLGLAVVAGRLFVLEVIEHGFYEALAENQHGLFETFYPERGTIYLTDMKSPDGRFPAAVNKDVWLVYADPRSIANPIAEATQLAPLLELDEKELADKLGQKSSAYQPLTHKVTEDVAVRIRELKLAGIGFAREQVRVYPDSPEGAQTIGFVGSDENGNRVGRYGVEGYWNPQLSGETGFMTMEKDPFGRLIGSATRDLRPARDGDDLTLSIDRMIQHVACSKLREAVKLHGATGGSVVVMRPKTGAILAMCGYPDFDANAYSSVTDMSLFNNPAIFTPYEPGSIFKPITMAAAIDAGKVAPNTTYDDEGSVVIGPYTIKNSDGKANGIQTMTQVLEKSLNTGAIFAVRLLGPESFQKYVEDFGFGQMTGVDLDTEASGNIDSLAKRGEIWSATGSFGQGISATTLQMAAAFSALANGGKLVKPYVVESVRHPDGTVQETEPVAVRQVITKRAATLVSGMLVKVVENGHGKKAGVPGYWVAGKTGTAQIPAKDGQGYEKDVTIGSFAGFAPVDDPAFVMVVRIDRPQDTPWAETSAAPLFGEIAKFLLQYMEIPPDRAQ